MASPMREQSPRGALALACLLVGLGCSTSGPVRWGIVLEPPERPGTRFEVTVRVGGCEGAVRERFTVRRGDAPRTLDLEPGEAALEVVATDDGCREYARGCTAFQIPVSDPIEVRVRSILDTPRCAPEVCAAGVCQTPDAGVDAGAGDGGPGDAGPGDAEGPDACEAGPRFVDEDGDGFGIGVPTEACAGPGFAEVAGDCDDGDAAVNPDGDELCNRRDDDCDGPIDEGGVPGEGCAPCERRSIEGADYLLCPSAMSWTDARDACEASGRALVKIETAEEDQGLRDAMIDLGVPQFWIGLEDLDAEGFQWVDGSPLGAYQPFILGDPDDTPPRCVRSVQDADPQGWRDRRCSDPFPFACDEP